MIQKKLEEIGEIDLSNLVANNILEKKTLEYKSQLPGPREADKKEFLADVSSFANMSGGDIVFGIAEKDSHLQSEIGMAVENMDQEIARLESLLRDGVSPRFATEMKLIDLTSKKKALVLRIPPSLYAPHRVTLGGHNEFYRRNANGKYPMDVGELRTAFLQQSEVTERIKRFRLDRITDVKTSQSPMPLLESSNFFSLHIVPLSAFSSPTNLSADVLLALKEAKYPDFSPMFSHGWSPRINLDGVVVYTGNDERDGAVRSYTQLFRDGKIEAVVGGVIDRGGSDKIPMYYLEKETMEYVKRMLKLLNELGHAGPYYVFLSLTGTRGKLVHTGSMFFADPHPITQNDLLLPEMVVEGADTDMAKALRPAFDMVWNASGISRSLSFDENGQLRRQ